MGSYIPIRRKAYSGSGVYTERKPAEFWLMIWGELTVSQSLSGAKIAVAKSA